MAADGTRILLVDIDGHGNVSRDLGYRNSDIDDAASESSLVT
ncbi:hypothetical protein ACWZEH_34370 (plasmid) [Streptomyces sp. QTS137]